MRVLALITDAFGGYGGIALYNRDVLTALCHHPEITEVVAIPRRIPNALEPLPDKLDFVVSAASGPLPYIRSLFGKIYQHGQFDFILCGHINLMPIAWLFGKLLRLPVILEIYGIDAWQPTESWLTNKLAGTADVVISNNKSRYAQISFTGISNTPRSGPIVMLHVCSRSAAIFNQLICPPASRFISASIIF